MLISKRNLLGTLLSLSIIGILFFTSSESLGDPVPGGPGYFMQPASAFRPDNPSNFDLNAAYLTNLSSIAKTFYAPVSLPQGATINKFILYYFDNAALLSVEGALGRIAFPGVSFVELAHVNSNSRIDSPASNYVETTNINNPVIDNQSYAYYVRVKLPATVNVNVNGFRIDYNFPINLPVIMK